MNKKVKASLVLFSLILGACSDMAASDPDIGLPADFDVAVYSTLNPDIAYNQILVDLQNNGYYNQPRFDSMTATMLNPATGNQMADTATQHAAKASYAADNNVFISDSAFAHKVFLMAGYTDSMWKGVDSLNSEQKKYIDRFNKQQVGVPSLSDDMAYIDNFVFDSTLIEQHYLLLGSINGRAYRYCDGVEVGDEKNQDLHAVRVGGAAKIWDYSAFSFCYDSSSGKIYAIK